MLYRCSIIMAIVLILFFMNSFPKIQHLSLGWVAFIGMLLLFIITDERNIDYWLHKVEWSTLIFIAALFVLMESLGELGLIHFLGDKMEELIFLCPPEHRLLVAICSIVWVRNKRFFFRFLFLVQKKTAILHKKSFVLCLVQSLTTFL